MVSLAQVAVYGIAGFALGNATTTQHEGPRTSAGTRGSASCSASSFGTGMALVFGALACRSVGIYFLMITLTFGVIANLFFGQVTQLSGFGGISGITTPGILGLADANPNQLYYIALVALGAAYFVPALPRAHAVRAHPAGHPRRPGAHELARLPRRAAPHARVRASPASSRRSAASSSSGGTGTSTRPRSTSARWSTCSRSP